MNKLCKLKHLVELLPAYRSCFYVFMMSQRPTDVNSAIEKTDFIKTNPSYLFVLLLLVFFDSSVLYFECPGIRKKYLHVQSFKTNT